MDAKTNAKTNGPRAYAYQQNSRRSLSPSPPPRLQPVACDGRPSSDTQRHADGCLSPWANPVTGALGWQVTTPSRRLAATVAAISGGNTRSRKEGKQWTAHIPETSVTVLTVGADSGALWCRLASVTDSGILTVAIAPWTTATVLRCPVAALPARGTLSVRDVRMTTRMGRTVRYLVPEFSPS